MKAEVILPPGRYHVAYGGQFEQLERARLRLIIVVPIALVAVGAYPTVTNKASGDRATQRRRALPSLARSWSKDALCRVSAVMITK